MDEFYKTIEETPIDELGIKFHIHNGQDGSPMLEAANILSKEEGGKFNIDSDIISSFSTDSTTYTEITGLTQTIEQNLLEKRYLLLFSGEVRVNSGVPDIIYLTFDIDGTEVGNLGEITPNPDYLTIDIPISLHWVSDKLAGGSHTFKVMVKTNTGTISLNFMKFSIIEITG